MLYLELNRCRERTFSKQIAAQIRQKILSGDLNSGDALPSTRDLSKDLCVARNTVLSAYECLVSEGFICSRQGSGYYVSPGITGRSMAKQISDIHTASLADLPIPDHHINFDSGLPALDLFPKSKWSRFVSRAISEAPLSALGYDDPQGRPELREVLSSYLKRTRGILCKPEQIVITAGTKQGLSLVAKSLLHAESEVWIENPGNENVKQIFSYHTDHITGLEVDEEGIQPELFPPNKNPALIFVTPSHQLL